MADERRTWLPFAAAAIVAAIIVTVTLVSAGGGSTTAALTCPKAFPTGGARPWVPHRPSGVDGRTRLAPEQLPVSAVVCSYDPPAGRGRSGSDPLRGRRRLGATLDPLVDTVAYLPRAIAAQTHCGARLAAADEGHYLLGLSYTGGTEWISASLNTCARTPTSDGEFDSSVFLVTDLHSAYRSGRWPAPRPGPCAAKGRGRIGQESELVPGGPDSLDVCRLVGGQVRAHVHDDADAARTLAAALAELPTTAMTTFGGCFGWYGSPDALVDYSLVFHYPFGADVTVTAEASKDCTPPVGNGSRQTSDAAAVIARAEALLTRH